MRLLGRLLRSLLYPALLLAAIWLGGFAWFLGQIPETVEDGATRTDAIIALTGGSIRVEESLALLRQDLAPTLYVTGVGKDVKVRELFIGIDPALSERIILGFSATNTRENALEARAWVEKGALGSIRLVTANYHMPRSLAEFRRLMPSVRIIPHPVFPGDFKYAEWWRHAGTAELLVSEYNKLIASAVFFWLGVPPPSFAAAGSPS